MLLVLIGAGASHGSRLVKVPSGVSDGIEPPLTNKLFACESARELIAQFPEVQPILSELGNSAAPDSDSLEKRLGALASDIEQKPARARQVMALRFFLAAIVDRFERIWSNANRGQTCYERLVDIVHDWQCERGMDVATVSFNYDTLFENAAQKVLQFDFTKIQNYAIPGAFSVYKPHGSHLWGYDVEFDGTFDMSGDLQTQIIARAFRLKLKPEAADRNSARVPALALPVDSKQTFACPDSHLAALREQLSKVTRTLVIGWRGAEPHFLEVLKGALPANTPLHVVSGSDADARQVCQTLSPIWRAARTPSNLRFRELVDDAARLKRILDSR